jgi:ketosteroid isomerase-like protein
VKALALAVIVALVAVTSPVFAQKKTDPVLDKLAREFATAMNAKNAALVASFYAEDAVLMPADERIVRGRANIEAYYRRNFQEDTSELKLTPLESSISGDQAFEAGLSEATHGTGAALLGGRPPITEQGKYVVIYRRVGSDWKIAYDIFNNN